MRAFEVHTPAGSSENNDSSHKLVLNLFIVQTQRDGGHRGVIHLAVHIVSPCPRMFPKILVSWSVGDLVGLFFGSILCDVIINPSASCVCRLDYLNGSDLESIFAWKSVCSMSV